MSKNDIFENENKIRKIGGRLESDYYNLRGVVLYHNENLIPLFYYLGLAKEENKDRILEALQKGRSGAASLFFDLKTQAIEEGRLPIEKVVSAKSIAKKYPTKEQKESQMRRAIKIGLKNIYEKIEKEWEEDCKPSFSSFFSQHSNILTLCRDTIKLTPSGLAIDVDKFIQFYTDFLEADESTTKKQHQEAADALNRFFNGAVEITQKELERYFLIEYGIVKPNPESINKESYARLGARTCKVSKKKK